MHIPVRETIGKLHNVETTNPNDKKLLYPLPSEFEFLADFPYSILELSPGDVIFQEGEGCGRIGFLLSGSVRVYKFSETGREMTLYRLGAGESSILSMS